MTGLWAPLAGSPVDGTLSRSSGCGCPAPCQLWSTPSQPRQSSKTLKKLNHLCRCVPPYTACWGQNINELTKPPIGTALCVHSNSSRSLCAHLVQGPHWDLAYIIGDVLPGGALRVAGCHTMPVPQVAWNKVHLYIMRPAEKFSSNKSMRVGALPLSSTV